MDETKELLFFFITLPSIKMTRGRDTRLKSSNPLPKSSPSPAAAAAAAAAVAEDDDDDDEDDDDDFFENLSFLSNFSTAFRCASVGIGAGPRSRP